MFSMSALEEKSQNFMLSDFASQDQNYVHFSE